MPPKVDEGLDGTAAGPAMGKHAAIPGSINISLDDLVDSTPASSGKMASSADSSASSASAGSGATFVSDEKAAEVVSATSDGTLEESSASEADLSGLDQASTSAIPSADAAVKTAKTSSRPKVPEKAKLTESEKAAASAKAARKRAERDAAARKRDERLDEVAKKRKRRNRKRRLKRVGIALIFLLAALMLAGAVAFGVLRWALVDDASDIQGEWRINGSDKIIEITDNTIVLTDEVAYKYTLNPIDKTIEFTFGNLSGSGKYRFSLDRQQLSITDGEYNWFDTAMDDAAWSVRAYIARAQGGKEYPPGGGEETTSFTRVGSPDAADASSANQTDTDDQSADTLGGATDDTSTSSGTTSGSGGGAQADNSSSDAVASDPLNILNDPSDILEDENGQSS